MAAAAVEAGGGGGESSGMPRMATRQTKGEQLRDKLGLNKEQQEEAQKILIAASRDAGPIRGRWKTPAYRLRERS